MYRINYPERSGGFARFVFDDGADKAKAHNTQTLTYALFPINNLTLLMFLRSKKKTAWLYN